MFVKYSLALAVSVLVIGTGVAVAGPLASDPNAWVQGNTTWRGTLIADSGQGLYATVDYCVYASGAFSYPGAGYTPTAGEFVYAYQIYSSGTEVVNVLSVGMLASNEANNIGSFDMGTGGTAPASAGFGGNPIDSANWSWQQIGGLLNAHSSGMAYSSVNAPRWWFGTVLNAAQTASGYLPSPSDVIPEPTTLTLLLGLGLIAVIRRKR